MKNFIFFLFILLNYSINAQNNKSIIYINNSNNPITEIALKKLSHQLEFETKDLELYKKKNFNNLSILILNKDSDSKWIKKNRLKIGEIKPEGYQFLRKENLIYIVGGDDRGLMYAILDLRDYLKLNPNFDSFEDKIENPHFSFRAIKFNLPWSSYRIGESIQMHYETVKDLNYWESFLDMMVDNRFNTLTLWNLHPFTFMIQPEGFPEANQFTGQEFRDWQKFWKSLFKMAKDRGIETYILNWNIITSPGMTETHNVANYKDDLEWHYGFTPADTSPIIVDYMRQCITQTINEYPNLTGVGVSMGERMKMPIEDAMEWVKNTFVEGIRQANRPAKFIHRAPFSINPEAARKYIESYTDFPDPIIMEFKFNWSHGHSSPNLSITHGGKIADQYWNPKPKNYKMAWMMRNEDFLMLNWSNTDFIRKHIEVNDHKDIVAGYFVGSETFIPAKEYRMSPDVKYEWKYAFEKQWEFYQIWGRLLYNPELSDSYFIEQCKLKYGNDVGEKFFKTLQIASEMPLSLASFYQGTWDFTLYCEGFLNGKQLYRNYKEAGEAFIRIDEMITHPTLDKRYLNIDEFTNKKLSKTVILDEEITPIEVANKMKNNGEKILIHYNEIKSKSDKNEINYQVELNDIKAWAYLSLYFSAKLNGAILLDEAVKTNNKNLQAQAIEHLKNAAVQWEKLIEATQQYQEVSLLHIRTYKFSWKYFYPKVLKDIEIAEDAL
ncbi:hypothetical protein [Lutibacter citreus]|uniref:hypothetical protein n=1 Tax=Lutibacter citreus TaxID=2138210 RepID=UPI001300659C|nr:hypothetical protein [Lutibacter citreus]